MLKVFILIIIVCTQGQPATTTEHQFNSMESCIIARDQALDIPFRFSREVKAFCVEK
jgi:hypothetical protein